MKCVAREVWIRIKCKYSEFLKTRERENKGRIIGKEEIREKRKERGNTRKREKQGKAKHRENEGERSNTENGKYRKWKIIKYV